MWNLIKKFSEKDLINYLHKINMRNFNIKIYIRDTLTLVILTEALWMPITWIELAQLRATMDDGTQFRQSYLRIHFPPYCWRSISSTEFSNGFYARSELHRHVWVITAIIIHSAYMLADVSPFIPRTI